MVYHAKDDFYAFSGRMGHKVYKGEQIQAQIRIQDIMQLQRYIQDPHDIHGGYHLSCKHHNYDACIYQALRSHMQNNTEDNCTVPWIPKNDKICKKPNDISTAFWITWNRSLNQKEDCDSPCHKMIIDVHGKNYRKYNTTKRNYGELYSYFSLDVAKSEEQYFYDVYRLMADVRIKT